VSRYAANTTVPSDRSRAEIEATLRRYGATAFGYAWEGEGASHAAAVMFRIANRAVRFRLPMPDPKERRFTHTGERNISRSRVAAEAEYDKAIRQAWRALLLIIKAKLEAVAAGVVSIESEFLAHTVLPNGTTVGEWVLPQIEQAYERDQMPALLPGSGS